MGAQVNPYLMSEDARAQAKFYIESLGGEILSVMTHEQMGAQHEFKDKVMHLSLVVAGGNSLLMADSFEPFTQGRGISLSVTYETDSEANEAFTKLAVGGNVKYPLELQPWGMLYGELSDQYGVSWMITAQPSTGNPNQTN
ncbi:glyoxalase [Paenibacillus swuensis]|uniref:Glyoxalase n=1 Tax=Paenibacillus swuensis TaxID=1178515 RepID=A0A172TFS9_9BACL|nr:VOC family protein [Paenibacillus swuensis]ANE45796.1 glyoxalase [Paenibacillus swuensis]